MNYDQFEELGRIRLSPNFFMRDFLFSEIAAWHGLGNVPDHPAAAVEVGRQLCAQLLEPLQATFGRLEIRSAYRSPSVNEFGNKNKLNCASNESNFAAHIWDHPDTNGKRGATACIVVPWLVDHIAKGGKWTDMAWWIHDHLPYNSLYFFSKLAAFNINWHEAPVRRIDSYASPKGCLTRPGMPNHGGLHADQYVGFPVLTTAIDGVIIGDGGSRYVVPKHAAVREAPPILAPIQKPPLSRPASSTLAPVQPATARPHAAGTINYRAIHTKSLWRKVNSHQSLHAAVSGKDGAAALFARKVRINYQTHGDPMYVLVWEDGSAEGYAIKAAPTQPGGIRQVTVPSATLMGFERHGHASHNDLEGLFQTTAAG